ncbi:hypothetical protein [Polyangium jinanense]|uniref:YD repeat-containing protein n=1 Tax=Polyangium jinanense TaxID=2829994 RepID=A0A9X3XG35_9BACT|nr:hypothetical protein [Polyangium jinanense]MDC3962810.1 hypothetical protein [Polyangium jinanense]MDC3988770.1 hypothetical protein [Polyangium jinanense]
MLRPRILAFSPLALTLLGCGGPATTDSPVEGVENDDVPGAVCTNRIDYRLDDDDRMSAVYHYDEAGRVLQYAERTAEGKRVFLVKRGYDAKGRRVTQTVEDDRLGAPHREMTWEWDDQDRVVRTTYVASKPEGDTRSESRFFFDAAGKPERDEFWTDGVLSNVTRYRYFDGEPFVLEVGRDNDADDTEEYFFRQSYAGQWLVKAESVYMNGEQIVTEDYSYDDLTAGHVSRRDFDADGDGQLDYVDRIFWNESGLIARVEYDTKGDGVLDQSVDFEYDAGRLVRRTWDVFDQGTQKFITDVTWSGARLTRVARRDAPTGQAIETWIFTHGCAGELPMDVPIAPIQGFRYELQTYPFVLRYEDRWSPFPEML